MITITKVVSRWFVSDFIAVIQNMFGKNLTSYEKMINKGINQIQTEIKEKYSIIKFKWYRYEIATISNNAVAIMFYGEEE